MSPAAATPCSSSNPSLDLGGSNLIDTPPLGGLSGLAASAGPPATSASESTGNAVTGSRARRRAMPLAITIPPLAASSFSSMSRPTTITTGTGPSDSVVVDMSPATMPRPGVDGPILHAVDDAAAGWVSDGDDFDNDGDSAHCCEYDLHSDQGDGDDDEMGYDERFERNRDPETGLLDPCSRVSSSSTLTAASSIPWNGRGVGYWRNPTAPPLSPITSSAPRPFAPITRGRSRGGARQALHRGGGSGNAASSAQRASARRKPAKRRDSVPKVPLFPRLARRRSSLPPYLQWMAGIEYELRGKRRFLMTLGFYLFCGWLNVVACNFADYRRAQLPLHNIPIDSRLPDIGHDYLPDLTSNSQPIPDFFIITLTAMTVIMLVFHKHRLSLLRRYFFTHGVLLIYRSITINVTTVPDPQLRCAQRPPSTDFFRQVNPFVPDTCGDMIFSGHSVVLTIVALAWHQYGPQHWSVKRSIWALSLLGMLSLIACRYHYTVDVVLSFGLTWLTWQLYGVMAQHPDLLLGPAGRKSPHVRMVKALEHRSSVEMVRKWRFSRARRTMSPEPSALNSLDDSVMHGPSRRSAREPSPELPVVLEGVVASSV